MNRVLSFYMYPPKEFGMAGLLYGMVFVCGVMLDMVVDFFSFFL